jgi:hypothetical protein
MNSSTSVLDHLRRGSTWHRSIGGRAWIFGHRGQSLAFASAAISGILQPHLESTSDSTITATYVVAFISVTRSTVFTWHVPHRLHLGALHRSGLDNSSPRLTFHSFSIVAMCPTLAYSTGVAASMSSPGPHVTLRFCATMGSTRR